MDLRTLSRAIAASCFAVSIASFACAEEVTFSAGDTFRDALRDGALGPEMIVLPAGSFIMGSPESEKDYHFHFTEVPQVEITISKPFAVGKYELTWDEWEACVAQQGCEDNSGKRFGSRNTTCRRGGI